MAVNWLSVVLAGLAGTVALTVLMLLTAAAGLGRLNFPMLLGTVFAPPGPQALALGMLWHLLNGLLFAAAYGLAFAALAIQPNWTLGLAAGLPHMIVAGLLLALLSAIHPRIRQGHMPAPGPFASRYGAHGLLVLLAAHLLYGALAGALL